jgi:hypothetical protein
MRENAVSQGFIRICEADGVKRQVGGLVWGKTACEANTGTVRTFGNLYGISICLSKWAGTSENQKLISALNPEHVREYGEYTFYKHNKSRHLGKGT